MEHSDSSVQSLEKTGYSGERHDLAQLVPASATRILDVGCATGGLGALLKTRALTVEVTGIEMSPVLAEEARGVLDEVLVGTVEASMNRLPTDFFDCIIFGDVLEHLVNPHEVLFEMRSRLRAGGTVIASIPNVQHHRVWRRLLMHGRWEYGEFGLLDSGHLRFFTLTSIIDMFTWAGYTVDIPEVHRVGLRRSWHSRRYLGNKLMRFIDYQYYVVARPMPTFAGPTRSWWLENRSM